MVKSKEAALFSTAQPLNDSPIKEEPAGAAIKNIPTVGDPERSDWVLSHLTESEKDKKNSLPKTEGLRRLVSLLLGDIVVSESHVVVAPTHDNFHMNVVEHTLVIKWKLDNSLRRFTATGESNENNTDMPFGKYPASNASTRALGRVCRDALQVKGCVAEEISDIANDSGDAPLTSTQKAGIESLCRKLSISVDKFINSGSFKYRSVDRVPTDIAKSMMSLLNKYQGGTPIPEEVKL